MRKKLVQLVAAATFVALAVPGLAALPANAGTPPSGFADSAVAGLSVPTGLASTGDGRMLITTQTGRLRVFKNGSLLSTPALDISAKICNFRERGLLGVAADPHFTSNGFIYIYYSFKKRSDCTTATQADAVNRVSRFTMHGDVADPSSEVILLNNIPTPFGYHNAGDVVFGTDGNLYVSVGDGKCYYANENACGTSNPAGQQKNALNGKILRITPTGGIPAGNPFTGSGTERCNVNGHAASTSGVCQEIYAYGFRNPFRFNVNRETGEIRVNDVGEATWEEIDHLVPGANYGWPKHEGFTGSNTPDSVSGGFHNPLYAYGRGADGGGATSITGGAFAPTGWATGYDGAYFFADYVRGFIKVLRKSGNGYSASNFETNLGGSSATSMEYGDDRGKLVLFYTTYNNGGQLREIVSSTPTSPPQADIKASPTVGVAPLNVTFDGSGSRSPISGVTITKYSWTFGDGTTTTTTGPQTTHTYSTKAPFTASLVVTDSHGRTSTPANITIHAEGGPSCTINSPTTSQTFTAGGTFTLSGSCKDKDGNALPSSAMTWTVLLNHSGSHTHPYMTPTTGNNLTTPPAPSPEGFLAAKDSYLEIHLSVTSGGVTSEVVQKMQPRKVAVAFATNPGGLQVKVDDGTVTNTVTTSASFTSWVGHRFTVNAPSGQSNGSGNFDFDTWSDGGAAIHTVTTPATDSSYTATFKPGTAVLLSQGKPIKASSEGGSGYVATNANDGLTTTRWASVSNVDPQWIRVDLGSAKPLSSVKLIWDLSCAPTYQIQTSNDDTTWTTVFSTTTGAGGTETIPVSATARYVRMFGQTRCRPTAGYSLQEFQVYGSNSTPPTGLLSQGKPIVASSEGGSGYVATNANDGLTTTRWASVSHVDPQWIRVDLGATKSISSVKLIWDVSCATSYQLQVSNDGTTFTNMFSTTTGAGGTETRAVSASGRYVRIFGTVRCRDAGYSLQEFQVFGS